MKSGIWQALAVALAALAPAACSSGEDAAQAGPEATGGIEVRNARMFLAPVSGNPAAVYFDLSNGSELDVTIAGASVEGVRSATLHHTMASESGTAMRHLPDLVVRAGKTVQFAPGGMHVMAEGVSDTLKPGATTEVTLSLAGGDEVSFPAEIRAAGDAR